MHAVILAAGRGSRLGLLTNDRPKPLMSLAGVPLLTRMITSLTMAGVERIAIVTGYRADLINNLVRGLPPRLSQCVTPRCDLVHNHDWERTGIASSILAAADAAALDHGGLVVYGDIVVESRVLTMTLAAPSCSVCLPINTDWLRLWQHRMNNPMDDAESLCTDADGLLLDIGAAPRTMQDIQAQFMGILRFDSTGATAVIEHYRAVIAEDVHAVSWDTTTLLRSWLAAGGTIATVPISGGWLEIDTPSDHDRYEALYVCGALDALCTLERP